MVAAERKVREDFKPENRVIGEGAPVPEHPTTGLPGWYFCGQPRSQTVEGK